jgi:ATPase family AAA domain-containing protein 1
MSIERPPSLLQLTVDRVSSLFSSRSNPSSGGATTSTNNAASESSNAESEKKEVTLVGVVVELALTIGMALVSSILLSLLTRRMLKGILPESDPETPERQVYGRLQRILRKRGYTDRLPVLSPRELQMADEILDPDDIESNFADIGGLDAMKQEIYELAVLPLVQPELFSDSKLVQPVKGILLYGKPGTGKTMLAKALAKESEAVFLPLQLSKILNKYWGESNKLIAATFSLAHKLQPAVIFIDELDTFLKNSNSETAYMDSIKAEFLTLWDGVATASKSRVLVLGATNKPQHIDPAILRRMPRAFEVPLPNDAGRLAILELLLKDENVDETVKAALPKLAAATNGYSGSDLKELCKAAAMVSVQERTAEFARRRVMGEADTEKTDVTTKIRAITQMDLIAGLRKVRRTGEAAHRYGKEFEREQQHEEGPNIDLRSLQNLAAVLRSLSSLDKDIGDEIPNLR